MKNYGILCSTMEYYVMLWNTITAPYKKGSTTHNMNFTCMCFCRCPIARVNYTWTDT